MTAALASNVCTMEPDNRNDPGAALTAPGLAGTPGGTDMAKRTPEERFWPKVDKDGPLPRWAPFLGPCWIWTGSRSGGGYGRFVVDTTRRESTGAHRFSYELLVGPIPEGLQIDHLCRVRACCNPAHLEPVTTAENVRRGWFAAGPNPPPRRPTESWTYEQRQRARRRGTHCRFGHPYVTVGDRQRCQVCKNAAQQRTRPSRAVRRVA